MEPETKALPHIELTRDEGVALLATLHLTMLNPQVSMADKGPLLSVWSKISRAFGETADFEEVHDDYLNWLNR